MYAALQTSDAIASRLVRTITCSSTCSCSNCTNGVVVDGTFAVDVKGMLDVLREEEYLHVLEQRWTIEDYYGQHNNSGRKMGSGKGDRVRAHRHHLELKKIGRQYCHNKWRRR